MDMHTFRTLIGTVTVTESFEVTELHPYAAYFTTHLVQPGEYPVYVESKCPEVRGNAPHPYYLAVTYTTTIAATDGYRSEPAIGTQATRTQRPHAYQCASELADDSASVVTMLGGRFEPTPGRAFAPCVSVDGSWRYGTAPVVTRADLPTDFNEGHLPCQ